MVSARLLGVGIKRRGLILVFPWVVAGLLLGTVRYVAAWPQAVGGAPAPGSVGKAWGGALPDDVTLYPEDNPHRVDSDWVVPVGVTLTVEPGAELYFAPNASLIVYGRLLAEGTPTQTILFTRRDAGTYWGAITVLYSTADNRIAYAVIEYTSKVEGDIPRSHGVTAYGSTLTLADSVLRYTGGKDGAGVVADMGSTLYVLRNEIHDIGGDAVHPTGGVVVIQGNHIYNARWGDYYYEGIEISKMSETPALVLDNHIHHVSDDCLDVNDSWVLIERNRLHHCADKGISIGSAGNLPPGAQPASATLVNNLVYASAIGVAVKDSTVARLTHNTLADNGIGLALYQAHDHPGYGGGDAMVLNGIVWGNAQAIDLDALSTVSVTYSDIEGGWAGTGNLDTDPLFQDALSGDYYLGDGSPAIDAGQKAGVLTDLEGRRRPLGRAPDLGAFERASYLVLSAWPGDAQVHLAWWGATRDPALTSFAISFTVRPPGGSAVYPSHPITVVPIRQSTTHRYTLTHLDNYAWYTIVVEGWDSAGGVFMRSNPVGVMPTDCYVYLPLALAAHP